MSDTTVKIEPEMPELPGHPESQIMRWSEMEKKAIRAYALSAIEADRNKRAVEAEIPRAALSEFTSKFCLGKSELVACAEAAFYAFNQALAAQGRKA